MRKQILLLGVVLLAAAVTLAFVTFFHQGQSVNLHGCLTRSVEELTFEPQATHEVWFAEAPHDLLAEFIKQQEKPGSFYLKLPVQISGHLREGRGFGHMGQFTKKVAITSIALDRTVQCQ